MRHQLQHTTTGFTVTIRRTASFVRRRTPSSALSVLLACLCLVAISTAALPAAASTSAAPNGIEITNVSYTSDSSLHARDGRTYVTHSGNHTMTATVEATNGTVSSDSRICVSVLDRTNSSASNGTNVTRTPLSCEPWPSKYYGSSTLPNVTTTRFELGNWTKNRTGSQTLSVTLYDGGRGSEVVAQRNLSVYVIDRDGDIDEDRLTNAEEIKYGTNISQSDTDQDGLEDGPEIKEYGTDPLLNDTDKDGLHDAREVNGKTDPTEADSDGDGLLDGPEVNDYDTDPMTADSDHDGLNDGAEVHVYETKPNTADSDDDGLNDGPEVHKYGTDPLVADSDHDGLDDGREVQLGTDPLSADSDGDFLNDGTEVGLGSDPTNGLTTVMALLVVLATLTASIVLFRRTGVPIPDVLSRAGGGPDDGGTGAVETPPPPPITDDGLLTDEDRVLRLLNDRGGRIQQSNIIEETDWSKSKVSRLLSRMEENDQIRKITVGRKNIITLPGHEPDGAKSPLEE